MGRTFGRALESCWALLRHCHFRWHVFIGGRFAIGILLLHWYITTPPARPFFFHTFFLLVGLA